MTRSRRFISARSIHIVTTGVLVLATALLAAPRAATAACDPTICGTSPCTITGTTTLDSGCDLDFGSKDVILTGTLQGDNNADCYYIKAHDLTVRGTLRARGSCIVVELTGTFKTEIVSSSAARVDTRDVDSGGDGTFITAASIVLNGRDINADSATGYFGGEITLNATSGSITGSGGSQALHANGSGGADGGTITVIADASSINLPGSMEVNGGGASGYGGTVYIEAATSVTLGGALQAHGGVDGDGGTIEVYAHDGTAAFNGALAVYGNGEATAGGTIYVEADDVTTGTTWNARGDGGGDGGSITVYAFPLTGTGTITTTNGAASFDTVGGSGGGSGGDIDIEASGSITLAGDMDSGGQGEFASAGRITIYAGLGSAHTLSIQNTSRIEADSTGTDASDGYVDIWACNISIAGVVDTRNTNLTGGGGWTDLTYPGTFTAASSSSLLADDAVDGGANAVYCRCIDTTPADGVCDTPATCVSSPTFNGTVTPAADIIPIAMTPCG
jgi:hypothetical protein